MAPKQKPGKSKQDYETPLAFIEAALRRLELDHFDADLAAAEHNALFYPYFTRDNSAFDQPTWKFGSGYNWLNPPFANIGAWVERAYKEMHNHCASTAVLIPASTGANWWRDFVHGKAMVWLLNGRLTFGGCPPNPRTGKVDAYPKDCALLLYNPREHRAIQRNGDWPYDVWEWTKTTTR